MNQLFKNCVYLCFCASVSLFLFSCSSKAPVDLIVHNAVVYTVDSTFTVTEALAVQDGKIIATGSNDDILSMFSSDSMLDAGGSSVYPGFIDAHCHFLSYGLSLQRVDLTGTKSFDEVIQRVIEFAKTNPDGWILGRGWDQNDWEVKKFPNKDQLDSLFPDRPVFIKRVDGHAGLANKKALDLAGVVSSAKVSGGEILTTGILTDNAMDLVDNVIPQPSAEQMRKALADAQRNCLAVGLTTVDDAGLMWNEVDVIQSMQDAGEMKMRVYVMLSDSVTNYDKYLEKGPVRKDRLKVAAFKFYGDGALGSRGACLLHPYSDMPGHTGFILRNKEHYDQYAHQLYEKGFQMNTHCIGDSANRMMLELYGHILGGKNDVRWRIEHCQVINTDDFKKFAEYSIIPSVQPTHATSDMYWADERLGPDRVKGAYAYQDLIKHFGLVALGTDFPVEGINPMNTFYAAVARIDLQGEPKGGFQMENALTREQALKGMTIWAAFSNFEEKEKGSLENGKFADFVILDKDIMKASDNELPGVKVKYTFINGEKVFKQ